ncbi:hypothetical protein EYF80_006562 [Liparis tanakae]|uniref:Uncharacterized protein n=1 Tax=Liparis tanakae TaxID=230148 RepID=A0A4Z2IZ11_9TELE|nr:hypothetical protein EYF80_006562 [Liparis tanakae]
MSAPRHGALGCGRVVLRILRSIVMPRLLYFDRLGFDGSRACWFGVPCGGEGLLEFAGGSGTEGGVEWERSRPGLGKSHLSAAGHDRRLGTGRHHSARATNRQVLSLLQLDRLGEDEMLLSRAVAQLRAR